jgi:hypothetical protein
MNPDKIGTGFDLRILVKFHYQTVAALPISRKKMIETPEFIVENSSILPQRGGVMVLDRVEIRPNLGYMNLTAQCRNWAGDRVPSWRFFRLIADGPLLAINNIGCSRVSLPQRDRRNFQQVWDASVTARLNTKRQRAGIAQLSKTELLSQRTRFFCLTQRHCLARDPLVAKDPKGYAVITAPTFWPDNESTPNPSPTSRRNWREGPFLATQSQ